MYVHMQESGRPRKRMQAAAFGGVVIDYFGNCGLWPMVALGYYGISSADSVLRAQVAQRQL